MAETVRCCACTATSVVLSRRLRGGDVVPDVVLIRRLNALPRLVLKPAGPMWSNDAGLSTPPACHPPRHPHMASHKTTRLRTAMGLWLMGRLPAHIMTHNEKTRRSGSSDKSNSGGIATQHHRCNGKSFQCPFNVTVLCDHTLLWASTCSVVLVLAIMLGAAPGATRKPRMCSFLPKCSATEHRHALHERSCDYRTGSDVRFCSHHRSAACRSAVLRPDRPTMPPTRQFM